MVHDDIANLGKSYAAHLSSSAHVPTSDIIRWSVCLGYGEGLTRTSPGAPSLPSISIFVGRKRGITLAQSVIS